MVAHLLVSLEVKFQSMTNADTKTIRNCSVFLKMKSTKITKKSLNQKQTNKTHKHPLPHQLSTSPKQRKSP